MRLIKLTLSGFKSFADTTEFVFERPITGVVGPNGCGKSNVVDAIKWVLGERSSKSLRGTEMLDVIFAGSAARKPMGMASVKLTFENPVKDASTEPTRDALPSVDIHELQDSTEVTDAPGEPPATDSSAEGAASDATTTVATVRPRRALPIDADIVEIERRLYRDGGSEYVINGKQARLKDIRELFLDTGVGADAYSIIEQGKVDAMLLASPQERRVIFEEAAGIAKYKQRRVEAQRRLERATTNLKGAKEQLESTERRLRLVKGQAAKARRFVELDAELKAWREALTLDQYDDLCARIDGLTSRQAEASSQRDACHAHVAGLEQGRQEAEAARHERGETHKRLEQELLSAQHARSQAEQRRTMLGRLIEQSRADAAADRDALAQLRERSGTTQALIADAREQVGALAERWQEGERRLQAAASERAGLLESLGESQRASAQKSADATRIERERAAMLGVIEGESTRASALREQLERIESSVGALAQQRAQSQSDMDATGESLRAAQGAQGELERGVQALEGQLADLGADRQARATEVARLDQELARVESRRATLQETMQARVGFAEAVRRALELRARGEGFSRVIAPLADLVQTHSRDHVADVDATIAVELALGQDLQALVAQSHDDVASAQELARVGGRVAFLLLRAGEAPTQEPDRDQIAGDAAASDASGVDAPISDDARAKVVRMRSLVRARAGEHSPEIDALLDRLLGRTYLVEDLDAALLLEAGPLRGARFVTRRGEIFERGRVIAGPTGLLEAESKGAGAGSLLRRQVELESLGARSEALATDLATLRSALAGVDAEANSLTQRVGEARQRLAQAQRATLAEQNKLDRLTHDLARQSREEATLEQDRIRIRERIASAEQDIAQRREKAQSLGRLAEELLAAATALAGELARQSAAADEAGERVTAAKVEVGTLSEQLAGARRELSRQESAQDELERRTADLASRVAGQESRVHEHEAAMAHAAEIVAESIARGDTVGAELAQAREALEAAQARAEEISVALQSARQQATIVERDFHSLEVSRRELEVKRETMEERAMQDFSLPLASALPEYRALLEPTTAEDGETVTLLRPDHALAQTAIDDLKDAIKRLGNVNMDALQEETTLEGQNESLVRQVADIEAARDQLSQLIEQLNVVSKERFEGIFSTIQRQFGGEQGMFRKLFGGGRAEVRLMPLVREVEQPDGSFAKIETDQYDVLESGIEVIAKPPGKEPRAISQLSGGEKTLTAVALLLSIFRSKPSCFCILDEVDAALDEGNVGRFNGAIRDFTDKSSFIVITHNKRTMQNADHLYGVTMQERGVSTRVSVRFEQVGKDGKIEVKAEVGAANASQPSSNLDATALPSQQLEAKPSRRKREKADKSPAGLEPASEDVTGGSAAVAIAEAPASSPLTPVAPALESEPVIAPVAEPVIAPIAEPVAELAGDGLVTVISPPVRELAAVVPTEASSQAPTTTPTAAPALHVAPMGIGDQPNQQTTLGTSPLKRALQRLREVSGE